MSLKRQALDIEDVTAGGGLSDTVCVYKVLCPGNAPLKEGSADMVTVTY